MDDRLRLATALVHARPGGQLAAVGPDGHRVVVGSHPSADADPCRWRATLVAAIDGRASPIIEGMELQTLGGSLAPSPSGGVDDRTDPDRRWFALALPPRLVVDVLRSVDLEPVPAEAITAVVRPDPALGVTVVGIGVDPTEPAGSLDRVATAVAGAWAVAELCLGLSAAER